MQTAANTLIKTFYQTRRYQDLGILRSVEQKIHLLSDSRSHTDSTTFLNRWLEAKAANDSVNGTENYTQNEKWVNELMLRFLRWGRDSLSNEELEQMQTLAHSCPAAEGLGVFYARYLNTFFEPLTEYDDYQLCNGANKGGKGGFDDLLNFLQETGGEFKDGKINNGLLLYPVPAHEMLNIELEFELALDAQFELYDLTGKLVATTQLKNGSKLGRLSAAKLAPGIYGYRFVGGVQTFFGTINIQH